jgi:predicted esterase YcpF (UPF0227 family)
MPDEMLSDAIKNTEIAWRENKYDLEGKGHIVSLTHEVFRLLRRLKLIWMLTGNHTGMYF